MRSVCRDRFTYDCDFHAILRPGAQRSRLALAFLEQLLAAHRASA